MICCLRTSHCSNTLPSSNSADDASPPSEAVRQPQHSKKRVQDSIDMRTWVPPRVPGPAAAGALVSHADGVVVQRARPRPKAAQRRAQRVKAELSQGG